jgi:hypothetical protein
VDRTGRDGHRRRLGGGLRTRHRAAARSLGAAAQVQAARPVPAADPWPWPLRRSKRRIRARPQPRCRGRTRAGGARHDSRLCRRDRPLLARAPRRRPHSYQNRPQ